MKFIDYGIYGDGDIYESNTGIPFEYATEKETHGHYLSVRINYTATVVPGESESFRIHHLSLRNAPDRQGSFTHEAFVDRVEPSGAISVRVQHSGSEMIVSHMQLIAQRKKHQPKG